MKKWIYILIGVVILCLIIFFAFGKKASLPRDTSVAEQVSSTPISVSVSVLHSDVQVESNKQVKLLSGSGAAKLGDVIKTLESGRALIASESGTETLLDYNSQLTVVRHDADGSHDSSFLNTGSVWSRVKKIFGQGEFYEIETQNAVAVVRGTSFGVNYENKQPNGQTILEVTTGTVRFMPVDQTTRARLEAKAVLVTVGQKATLGSDGIIHLSSLTLEDKKQPWYQFNNPTVNTTQGGTSTHPPSTPPTPTTTIGVITPPTTQTQSTLSLTSASPASGIVGDRVYLKGSGFLKVTTLVLGRSTLSQANMTVTSDTALNFSTANLSSGTYDISVVDVSGKTATLTNAITLQSPPPPPPTNNNATYLKP